jgi:hypothetical protein
MKITLHRDDYVSCYWLFHEHALANLRRENMIAGVAAPSLKVDAVYC